MANIIRVVLEGSDQTSGAFASAARNAQKFTTDVRASNVAFVQFGNIASSVGAQSLAGLIMSFEQASAAAASMVGKLGQSKLAVAALGAAVAAAGFKLGSTLADMLGFTGAGDEKVAAFNDQMSSVMRSIEATQNKLSGDNSLSAELQRINEEMDKLQRSTEAKGAFGGPSWLGGKAGMKAEDVEALLDKYRELRALTIQTGEAEAWKEAGEKSRDYMQSFDRLIQQKYEAQDATLGLMEAERQRHEKALQEIFNEFTINQGRDNLIEAELLAHEERKLKIKKDYADKQAQIAADAARREQQLRQATLSATAGLFGSLSALAAAQGRKGFALAQGFRYAETIVNTAAGVGRALADYPYPMSIIIGALVAAAGAAQLATIASAKPSGQAHSGLTSVSEGGSFDLVRGERVVAANQNRDLSEFLEHGGQTIRLTVNLGDKAIIDVIERATRSGQIQIDARSIT